jgi:hypothetical protein
MPHPGLDPGSPLLAGDSYLSFRKGDLSQEIRKQGLLMESRGDQREAESFETQRNIERYFL